MIEDSLAYLIVAVSAIGFVGLWLVVTSAITRLTPWHELETLYPDKSSAQVKGTLRFQGAYLGRETMGVSFQGCLTYQVTNRGLRIAIWKLLIPFAKPILIPWDAIETQAAKTFMLEMVRLRVGRSGTIWITIATSVARRISDLSENQFSAPDGSS